MGLITSLSLGCGDDSTGEVSDASTSTGTQDPSTTSEEVSTGAVEDSSSTGPATGSETTQGDTDTPSCGDDMLGADEVCDGIELGGEDCASQGFDGGDLACAADCGSYDTSGCTTMTCGDGAIDGKDTCDGADLGDEDCASQGFDGGDLACADDCSDYDTTGCFMQVCGNGDLEGDEACDGKNLADQDCVSVGYLSGLLACGDDCSAFDTSACDAPVCSLDFGTGPAIGNAILTGSTAKEDNDVVISCGGGGGAEHLFAWVSLADDEYTFDTDGSDYNTALAVFSDCDSASELACDDDGFAGSDLSQLTVTVAMNESVLLAVEGSSGATGEFVINVIPSLTCADEDIDTATGDDVATGDTSAADNDIVHPCAADGPEHLVRFMPTATGTHTIDTAGSDFNTVLAVYEGCHVAYTEACNDDALPDGISQVEVELTEGIPVLIGVGGSGDETGNFALNITPPA